MQSHFTCKYVQRQWRGCLVCTAVRCSSPVVFPVVQVHDSDTLKAALEYIKERLYARFGIVWRPTMFMVDDSPVERAAIFGVWGPLVRIKICMWHVLCR